MKPEPAVIGERLHTIICHVDEVSTRDGVPVNVSVTVSWQVQGSQEAESSVVGGWQAIRQLTRAPLRTRVTLSTLADLLCDRAAVEQALWEEFGLGAGQLGMTVQAVAVREVGLPPALRAKGDALTLLALDRCRIRQRPLRDNADRSASLLANR